MDLQRELGIIKNGILETVPTKAIYLIGSYAYGNPTEDSDLVFMWWCHMILVNWAIYMVIYPCV